MNFLKEIANITVSHVLKGDMHFEDLKEMMHRNMIWYPGPGRENDRKASGLKELQSCKQGTDVVWGGEVPEGEQSERREAEEPRLQDGQDYGEILSVAQTLPEPRGKRGNQHQEVSGLLQTWNYHTEYRKPCWFLSTIYGFSASPHLIFLSLVVFLWSVCDTQQTTKVGKERLDETLGECGPFTFLAREQKLKPQKLAGSGQKASRTKFPSFYSILSPYSTSPSHSATIWRLTMSQTPQ